jgi:hypothetical protein
MTANQTALLHAILTNDFTAFNGGLPGTPDAPYTFDSSDWAIWSNSIDCCLAQVAAKLPKGRALSATVSTLVRAGLLTSDGECICFTAAGYKAARDSAPI